MQAPDVMRSCSMALCLLSTALGSYLAGALTLTVQAVSKRATGTEWLPRDLNKVHTHTHTHTEGRLRCQRTGTHTHAQRIYYPAHVAAYLPCPCATIVAAHSVCVCVCVCASVRLGPTERVLRLTWCVCVCVCMCVCVCVTHCRVTWTIFSSCC